MPEDKKYIQGFNTTNGVAKYDYNALANIPQNLIKVIMVQNRHFPEPFSDYVGTIAIAEDDQKNDTPFICFQKDASSAVWVSFDGTEYYSVNQLGTPTVRLVTEGA